MSTEIPFQISGLDIASFTEFFGMTESELADRGARRCIADTRPGFPCRVSLQDAQIGEAVILTTYAHHKVPGPYHASGPIYVRVEARPARLGVNEIPQVLHGRMISVRAYDAEGWMLGSNVIEGSEVGKLVDFFFEQENVAYLHLHNAKPGCFSCRVDRA